MLGNRTALLTFAALLSPMGCDSDGSPAEPVGAGDPQPLTVAMVCATSPVGNGPLTYRFEIDTTNVVGRFRVLGQKGKVHPAATDEGEPFERNAEGSVDQRAIALRFDDGRLDASRPVGAGKVFEGTLTVGADQDVPVACWIPGFTPTFRYLGPEEGCRNATGATGTNAFPIAMIRETKHGECVDLSGVKLTEGRLDVNLEDWNLKGSNLAGAKLHFANLRQAQLEGADLTTLDFGYANIDGSADQGTRIPDTGCVIEIGTLNCRR
jgi:hypothetical protein